MSYHVTLLISSHLLSSLFLSLPFLSGPLLSSRRVASRRVASHRVASRRVASLVVSSRPISSTLHFHILYLFYQLLARISALAHFQNLYLFFQLLGRISALAHLSAVFQIRGIRGPVFYRLCQLVLQGKRAKTKKNIRRPSSFLSETQGARKLARPIVRG